MQINLKEYTNTLKTVALAASKDQARPVLNGIYFECKKNTLSITAADGFRLVHGEIKISNPNNETWGTIIPAKDLAALKLKGTGDIEITHFNNGLKENPSEEKYNDSGLVIAGNKIQCIDGTFPDYWRIVPDKKDTKREILAQLGGRQFTTMVGAKYITACDDTPLGGLSLRFKMCSKANYIKITVDEMDTYTVAFHRINSRNIEKSMTPVKVYTGVYNDMLQDIFKSYTGLETSLGTLGR